MIACRLRGQQNTTAWALEVTPLSLCPLPSKLGMGPIPDTWPITQAPGTQQLLTQAPGTQQLLDRMQQPRPHCVSFPESKSEVLNPDFKMTSQGQEGQTGDSGLPDRLCPECSRPPACANPLTSQTGQCLSPTLHKKTTGQTPLPNEDTVHHIHHVGSACQTHHGPDRDSPHPTIPMRFLLHAAPSLG